MCRFIASILLYGEENEPENGRYRVARGDGDVEEEVPITVFSSFSFHTNGFDHGSGAGCLCGNSDRPLLMTRGALWRLLIPFRSVAVGDIIYGLHVNPVHYLRRRQTESSNLFTSLTIGMVGIISFVSYSTAESDAIQTEII